MVFYQGSEARLVQCNNLRRIGPAQPFKVDGFRR